MTSPTSDVDFCAMHENSYVPYDPDEIVSVGRSVMLEGTSRHLGSMIGAEMKEVVDDPCPVYGDRPHEMTNARLWARFLSRFSWYRPGRPERSEEEDEGGEDDVPDLDAAWAHYEHWTLARYYTDTDTSERDGKLGVMDRAHPGDSSRPTALYPVWATPLRELTDFGISVRLYFTMLLALSAFLLAAGMLNVPLLLYFKSYGKKDGIPYGILGSAICDDAQWVPCDTCFDVPEKYPSYRLDYQNGNVLANRCDFENWLVPGLFSFLATIVLLVLWSWFFAWQRKAEVMIDEDVQTTSDYSIKISNPPPDALDPEEWRNFLMRFTDSRNRSSSGDGADADAGAGAGGNGGGVAMCTIALDNAELIKALTKRRRLINQLSDTLPPGIDMTDDAAISNAVFESPLNRSLFSRLFLPPDAHSQYSAIKNLDKEIVTLATCREYKAVDVFVTFETERGQRNALHALSTGKMNIWFNRLDTFRTKGQTMKVHERAFDTTANVLQPLSCMSNVSTEAHDINLVMSIDSTDDVSKYLLFRGQQVLGVSEAMEPNNIRWSDLQVRNRTRVLQYVGTTLAVIVFMGWSGFFIKGLVRNNPGSHFATVFIAVTNAVIPKICKAINKFESHPTEGKRQCSLYVKIALFRWFNSAIVLSLIFNFIETISIEDGNEEGKESLIYSVFPIIFAEIFTCPVLKIVDIGGNVKKHVLAPRAKDQHEMNTYFVGGNCELADLYTDATKVVFVALFYSSIFPGALFLGALALLIQFCAAKFCLLRLWRSSPDLGNHLARLSRNYFFTTAIVTHVVMSAYWWSGYPYDKVCSKSGEGGDDDGGYYDYYYFCSQDLFRHGLPPLPRFQGFQVEGNRWMTSSQETLTSLYGWTSLAVLILATITLIVKKVYPPIRALYRSPYAPDGKDQNIPFRDVKHLHEVRGYIPQSHEAGFAHPLLAADMKGVDEDLVGWRDDINGLDSHNLYHDLCRILGGNKGGRGQEPARPVFSIIKQWDNDATEKKT